MYQSHRVALIIPALNEEAAIGKVLGSVPDWVEQVIVVDNGSTDRTAEVARVCGARVVHQSRRGYGSACLAGIAAVDGAQVIAFMDGDFSDDPRQIERLVAPLVRDQADLVIGSRTAGKTEPGSLTVQQRFGNRLACLLIRLIYNVRFTDLGPFRAVRRDSLRRLGMDDQDYGWTVQMQVRAAKLKLRCLEVPVDYRHRIGQSKISGTLRGVISAGVKILYTIVREAFGGPACLASPPRTTVAGRPKISVIIPTLDEAPMVAAAIHSAAAPGVEVIVVDGGSRDETAAIAHHLGVRVLRSGPGRGRQMNLGAAAASGEILLFLHADSRLPRGYPDRVRNLLSNEGTVAGAFALEIEPTNLTMRLLASVTNIRSRWLGTPYGDQAIFLKRRTFRRVGGFRDLPIMEDLDFVRRLSHLGSVRIASATVRTSARRWQRHGAWRMSILNQLAILAYFLGASVDRVQTWRESGIILPLPGTASREGRGSRIRLGRRVAFCTRAQET